MEKQTWLAKCKESLVSGESIFINNKVSFDREELNYQFFIRSSEDANQYLSIDELLNLTIEEVIAPLYEEYAAYYNNQLKADEAISDYESRSAA